MNKPKQKECFELIDKINEALKIKINVESKRHELVWMRYYVVNKYEDYEVSVCSTPLNKHHASILYLRKNLPKIRKMQAFKDISKVVETLDIKIYKQFIVDHVKKRYDKKPSIPESVSAKKLPMKTGNAMMLLRKNRKSLLWNKVISDWNCNDWNELKTY